MNHLNPIPLNTTRSASPADPQTPLPRKRTRTALQPARIPDPESQARPTLDLDTARPSTAEPYCRNSALSGTLYTRRKQPAAIQSARDCRGRYDWPPLCNFRSSSEPPVPRPPISPHATLAKGSRNGRNIPLRKGPPRRHTPRPRSWLPPCDAAARDRAEIPTSPAQGQ